MVGRARYCCFGDNIDNAYTAIMERVFYHSTGTGFARPSVPSSDAVVSTLKCFVDQLAKYCTTTVPISLSVYPERFYRGRKLRIYQRARDNIRGRTPGKDFAALKTFIKHEKILLKDKRLVPRVIQPRSPEYNVCVGRYIRQLEHRIYGYIDSIWQGPTVMKGLNCFQQGRRFADAWSSFSQPVAIMLDAVRFDQHVSVPMLQWEHSIYLSFFPPCYRRELKSLLDLQLENVGRVVCPDGILRYKVDGCRASGDMNTAMGNVLIMCAAVYAFRNEHQVRCRLFNNGDDCTLLVEKADVARVVAALPGFFSRLGFIIDIEGTADILENISFCQTNPVFDGTSWRMVRNPLTAISKDATVLKRWSPKEFAAYLHVLGTCGLSAYADMPVWGSFYRCFARSTGTFSDGLIAHVSGPIMESGLGRLTSGVTVSGDPTASARASFALAFGLTPGAQEALEEYYDTMQPGSGIVHSRPATSLFF